MDLITEKIIQSVYYNCINYATDIIPLENWFTKPFDIKLTKIKSAYGIANKSGTIEINEAFLETSAHKFLRFVMLHELSHLIVGIHNRHNIKFKTILKILHPDISSIYREEKMEVYNKIPKKYMLVAILKGGLKVNIRKADRKHSRYTKYTNNSNKLYAHGFLIESFEYEKINN